MSSSSASTAGSEAGSEGVGSGEAIRRPAFLDVGADLGCAEALRFDGRVDASAPSGGDRIVEDEGSVFSRRVVGGGDRSDAGEIGLSISGREIVGISTC